ncbi:MULTISPECIES: halocyanin domain-containing protein [Salinibaculum]|uniref:halocyanin domain-containing protein n=1 Tax=Salinibaculum TaxID=2732368 RepID=UPI0030D535F5
MNERLAAATIDRRTVLRGVGTIAATGVLAGCSGGGDGGGGNPNVPDEVSNYLSSANNYGSVPDETGSGSVTVEVGAGNGLAFGPAAVRISTGTTVTWEWTGQGGTHNVVAEDGSFDSGEYQAAGTFEHTFDEAGNYNYYCEPHKMSGMKGAVIVE